MKLFIAWAPSDDDRTSGFSYDRGTSNLTLRIVSSIIDRLDVLRTLHVDRVTAEVFRALRHAGVDAVLLKGPGLEAWMTPDARPRTYVDSDFLVAPDALAPTQRVLRELEFRPLLARCDKHANLGTSMHWIREGDGANVDLHVQLTGIAAPADAAWRRLRAGTVDLTVAGEAIPIFREPARALHVALHSAQHAALFHAPQRDLVCALQTVPTRVWEAARELARELDAEPAMAAGLRLDPAGRRLAEALGLGDGLPFEVALRLRSATPLTLGIDTLLREPGLIRKLRLILRELFPSHNFMRLWSPLARRGWAGLVLAYSYRPFWLLVRLPAALRARRSALRRPGG